VHIANMNENSIPYIDNSSENNESKLEEEFCLAYVAATRARKNLRMYMQFTSGNYAGARVNKMSRFIKNLIKQTGEEFLTLRVLDVPNENHYKLNLLQKIKNS